MMEKKRHIIFAPHADDELIGSYSILNNKEVHTVICPSEAVKKELYPCAQCFGFDVVVMSTAITSGLFNWGVFARELGGSIFFPDPVYEWHPEHRFWGSQGEAIMRQGIINTVFYSINMTAPYIRPSINPEKKRSKLDSLYSSKKELWAYDHKYFLFEGHVQWLMNRNLCND